MPGPDQNGQPLNRRYNGARLKDEQGDEILSIIKALSGPIPVEGAQDNAPISTTTPGKTNIK